MFDETQHLVAWNGKFQSIFDLPEALLKQQRTYEEHLRFLAERGDFGTGVDRTDQIHALIATTGQPYGYERTRPDGRVIAGSAPLRAQRRIVAGVTSSASATARAVSKRPVMPRPRPSTRR